MIDLQKKYARDLLTHVNPYTKTAYCEESAVAMVEISNEDALFTTWNAGDLDNLPDPYATTYRNLWNAWLVEKYGTTRRLRKAWNVGVAPLGEEQLADPESRQGMVNVDILCILKTAFSILVAVARSCYKESGGDFRIG